MTAIEDESDRLFDEIAGLRSDFSALRHQMIVILAVEAVAVAGLLGVLVAAQI